MRNSRRAGKPAGRKPEKQGLTGLFTKGKNIPTTAQQTLPYREMYRDGVCRVADRYYTKTNLTTQGIGIIFKKDFNKWNELLFWNKWKLKRLKRKQAEKNTSAPDSIPQKKSRPEAQSKREREE